MVQALKSEPFFQLLLQAAPRTFDVQALDSGTFRANDKVVMLARHSNGKKWRLFANSNAPDQPDLFELHKETVNGASVTEFLEGRRLAQRPPGDRRAGFHQEGNKRIAGLSFAQAFIVTKLRSPCQLGFVGWIHV